MVFIISKGEKCAVLQKNVNKRRKNESIRYRLFAGTRLLGLWREAGDYSLEMGIAA